MGFQKCGIFTIRRSILKHRLESKQNSIPQEWSVKIADKGNVARGKRLSKGGWENEGEGEGEESVSVSGSVSVKKKRNICDALNLTPLFPSPLGPEADSVPGFSPPIIAWGVKRIAREKKRKRGGLT